MHQHQDDASHFHAHSHRDDQEPHAASSHEHAHYSSIPWRTFGIGLMHGLAGSAALVVLASTAMATPLVGILFVALFGFGSMLGMIVLSAVIAVPITYTAKYMTAANGAMRFVIGTITVVIGAAVVYENLTTFWA